MAVCYYEKHFHKQLPRTCQNKNFNNPNRWNFFSKFGAQFNSRNHAEGKFVIGDISKALASLPEAYHTPFIRYFEGFKYHEIADMLQIPLGTVKTRIFVAREMLKKYLKTYAKDTHGE